MSWRMEYSPKAIKQLAKIDAGQRRIILAWIDKNLSGCEDPRARGKGLTANRSGQWRCRIGDCRVLCEIRDGDMVILAIEVGHRRGACDR